MLYVKSVRDIVAGTANAVGVALWSGIYVATANAYRPLILTEIFLSQNFDQDF